MERAARCVAGTPGQAVAFNVEEIRGTKGLEKTAATANAPRTYTKGPAAVGMIFRPPGCGWNDRVSASGFGENEGLKARGLTPATLWPNLSSAAGPVLSSRRHCTAADQTGGVFSSVIQT